MLKHLKEQFTQKKLLSSEFKVETFSFKVENFEEYSTLDPIDFCCLGSN